MKVEQKKEFAPITITLETEEEAITMWGCLNTSKADLERQLLPCPALMYMSPDSMWKSFDIAFPLRTLKPKK